MDVDKVNKTGQFILFLTLLLTPSSQYIVDLLQQVILHINGFL